MIFRSGYDLEDAVFGRHSSGEKLATKFQGQKPNFDLDVRRVIRNCQGKHPDTPIGQALFEGVEKKLARKGIDTRGMVFSSTIDTKVDLWHFADGVFYLPAIEEFPVTVDLFFLYPDDVVALENLWAELSPGHCYSRMDLQNDLFRFNNGMFAWRKENGVTGNTLVYQNLGKLRRRIKKIPGKMIAVPSSIDFRQYCSVGRPENHFILTPYHLLEAEKRKEFIRMVAAYLVSKVVHPELE